GTLTSICSPALRSGGTSLPWYSVLSVAITHLYFVPSCFVIFPSSYSFHASCAITRTSLSLKDPSQSDLLYPLSFFFFAISLLLYTCCFFIFPSSYSFHSS